MTDQKPFCIQQFSSPVSLNWLLLLNSCPKQKGPKWLTLIVFMSFSTCPDLHVHLHSPWFYVTAGMKICDHLWYNLAGGSHVFSVEKINLACRAYVLTWVAIFIPIFITLPSYLMITNMAWRWHPFLPGASLWKCRVRFPAFLLSPLVWSFSSLVSASDVDCADECWPSDSQVAMTSILLLSNVLLLSSSIMVDLLCLWRSFMWQGVPLTSTVWRLILPSTCPL